MSLIIDEHRQYLSDPIRLDTFRRAIHASVHEGDVVVDLGSGTGILGLMACEAGARRVYSIEVGGMIEVAREIARHNGFGDRVVFVHGASTDVTLPEPADVVVTDLIGHFGFEVGLWRYFADARARLLRPGGRLVPGEVTLIVAPIEAPDLRDKVEFWMRPHAGFDFSGARSWAVHSGYPTTLSPDSLLGDPAAAVRVNMHEATIETLVGRATTIVSREGTLDGVGGWFESQLAPGVLLTNSPLAENRVARRNVFLPIDHRVRVFPGTRVEVSLHIDPAELMLTWTVEITNAGSEPQRFRHSTFNGMFLSRDDLRRMRPDFRPVLTKRGVARRTVLELCDGARSLDDVQRSVYERHRELFPSEREAIVFVAEVVSRYTD